MTPTRHQRPAFTGGFTLIEVLVAIGIMAVLVGMLMVGMKYLGASSNERATRQTLENCRAMLTELEAINKLAGVPAQRLPAPGNVTANQPDRTGNEVCYTRALIGRLLAVPNNRRAIQQFPASQLFTFNVDPPPAWGSGAYSVADRVTYTDTTVTPSKEYRYVCIQDHSGKNPHTAPDRASYWMVEDVTSPVLLDAWGNPILFVPSGGLGRDPADATPGQRVTTGGVVRRITSPDARPFFASAGPDGDFQKGDDNLYSFEN